MPTAVACERLVDVEDLACECDIPEDADVVNTILDGASDFLADLAGVPLGRCSVKYRPCREIYCRRYCNCCGLIGIHLPGFQPAVTQVLIDGSVVSSSEYLVIRAPSGRYVLERHDGAGKAMTWPACQNLHLPSTAEGTFEITVSSGYPVSVAMRLAAAEIACDLFAYLNEEEHQLPDGVAAALIYGTSLEWRRFGDPTNQATMSLAGLALTQRFLAAFPGDNATQILAPELDDGWDLYTIAA